MFLDGAVQAVSEGGLLCITCTDMAVLAGGQSEICWTKYGGTCIRGIPFCHELGIRLLLHTVATCAGRYKRIIEPLLCCSIDYYVRIFVRIRTKPELVKLNARLVTLIHVTVSLPFCITVEAAKILLLNRWENMRLERIRKETSHINILQDVVLLLTNIVNFVLDLFMYHYFLNILRLQVLFTMVQFITRIFWM